MVLLLNRCTSSEGASWEGQPLNIFTCFITDGEFILKKKRPETTFYEVLRASPPIDHPETKTVLFLILIAIKFDVVCTPVFGTHVVCASVRV